MCKLKYWVYISNVDLNHCHSSQCFDDRKEMNGDFPSTEIRYYR